MDRYHPSLPRGSSSETGASSDHDRKKVGGSIPSFPTRFFAVYIVVFGEVAQLEHSAIQPKDSGSNPFFPTKFRDPFSRKSRFRVRSGFGSRLIYCGVVAAVARRPHKPKVAVFESCPRNHSFGVGVDDDTLCMGITRLGRQRTTIIRRSGKPKSPASDVVNRDIPVRTGTPTSFCC